MVDLVGGHLSQNVLKHVAQEQCVENECVTIQFHRVKMHGIVVEHLLKPNIANLQTV